MTSPDAHDDGHLLPVAEWEQVVREAERGLIATAERPLTLGQSSFPSVSGFVPAKYNGGAQPADSPTFGVLHDAETPLAPGYALSISNYFTRNTNETSAHFMVGPEAAYQLLDTSLIGWHCGNGNRRSIGVEQAGYASFTRDQWLTTNGLSQVHRLASLMVDIQRAHGIGTYFMSDQQLVDVWNGRGVGGWATHDQCSRILGGSSHTDPMPNYPFDVLGQVLGGQPMPQPPAPPAPQGPPPTFGWNLARGNYYGNIAGPAQSHGGWTVGERPWVQIIQQWFIYLGCVPGVTDWHSGWADGKWEAATDTACVRWHARFYPGQPKPAQMWSDDLTRLFTSRP